MRNIGDLESLCKSLMEKKGLIENKYFERLSDELKEIDAQSQVDYFLEMYEKNHRYKANENNLLVPYVLGAAPPVVLDESPAYIYGDWPDIDTDFHPTVRDYLKNVWASQAFGQDRVCSIGSYTSFGIKSALIDMAKVHGKNRSEILELTTKLGLKDEDGKVLTWEKALEEYPDLRKYCEDNPDVAEAAKRLLHRNRGMGMHAGGLIISSICLDELVPLVKGKDNAQVSAWAEGLQAQYLGPMGLLKFDLLVITNLVQIARGVKLVKDRHGLQSFCAIPDGDDWSDTSYLNDKKALMMAGKGDLKCIFQFDSEGIRALVKSGGVDRFDDLVAYSALYRPGPMNCVRKDTKILVIGGEKRIDSLNPEDSIGYVCKNGTIKYTNKYILTKTGKKKILKIVTKSGKILYVSPDHLILNSDDKFVKAGELCANDKLMVVLDIMFTDEIVKIEEIGEDECFDITNLENNFYLDEPNFIAEGIIVHNCQMHTTYVDRKRGRKEYSTHQLLQPILSKTYGVMAFQEQLLQILNIVGKIPLKDCETIRKAVSKKKIDQFIKYKEIFIQNGQSVLGWTEEQVKDLFAQIESFAEYGFNLSHAVAYCYVSSRLLYLKAHYPLEFFTAVLSCEKSEDKIREYKHEASRHNIKVEPVDLNKSKEVFGIIDEKIYYGFANIKGIGIDVANMIVAGQPYSDFEDFLRKFGTDANVVKPLLTLRCFEGDPLRLWLYYEYYKDITRKCVERKRRFQVSQQKYLEELAQIGPWFNEPIIDVNLDVWHDEIGVKAGCTVEQLKALGKLQKKWARSIDTNMRKEEEGIGQAVSFAEWEPKDWDIDPEMERLLCDPEVAQKQFYGYPWNHVLEKSPDYRGDHTFERFRMEIESNNAMTMMVEVLVKSTDVKQSKSGSTSYLAMDVEDVNSESARVNVWAEDMERFKPEMVAGNLLKIRLKRPDHPYKTYTFESPPRHQRYLIPKDKANDYRLVVMEKPPKPEKLKTMTDQEFVNVLSDMEIYGTD